MSDETVMSNEPTQPVITNTAIICPLGKDCQRLEGETLVQCAWFRSLTVQRPGQEPEKQHGCSIPWGIELMTHGISLLQQALLSANPVPGEGPNDV